MNCLLIITFNFVFLSVLQAKHAEENNERIPNGQLLAAILGNQHNSLLENKENRKNNWEPNILQEGITTSGENVKSDRDDSGERAYNDDGSNDYGEYHEERKISNNVNHPNAEDLFSNTLHFLDPSHFKNLDRRFISHYPYVELESEDDEDWEKLHKILQAIQKRKRTQKTMMKKNKKRNMRIDGDLIPIKASRDLVLAIAKESKMLEDNKPVNPTEEAIQREILRSGSEDDEDWKKLHKILQAIQKRKRPQKTMMKKNKKRNMRIDGDLIPIKAPRDLVLAIAKASKMLEDNKPVNPTEEAIQREILRSGDYWDGVWKDDADPEAVLRTKNRYEQDMNKKSEMRIDSDLIPIKAPPEVVLAIAKASKMLEDSKPVNPTEELIQKEILRSGNYWDGVWKEDVDPETILRTHKRYKQYSHMPKKNQAPKLEVIKSKIMPGTKVYQLVSVLKSISPQLLYIVNNKNEEK